MLRLLCALALALSAAPISVVFAAPHRCGEGGRWGWPGFQMGNDRWGVVLVPSKSAEQGSKFVNPCDTSNNSSSLGSSVVSTVHVTTLRPTTSFTSFTLAPSSGISTSESSSAPSSTPSGSSLPSSSSAPTTTPTSSSIPSSSPATTSSSTPPPRPSSSEAAPSSPSSSPAEPSPTTTTPTSSGGGEGGGGSGSNGSKASASDVDSYLSAHNNVRAQHGASPLAWNNTLAAAAQKWSDGCVFQHSGGKIGPFGENLAAGTGDFSITSAVSSWTNEASQFNPNSPTASHFTQVVWKGSTQLGCAETSCAGGTIFPGGGSSKYYVCEYFPQGNVIGAFAQNVQA